MRMSMTAGASVLALTLVSGAALADGDVYADFPVTVKGYSGDKKTSVSYTGQIARHTLHDSLKKLANSGNGKPNAELKAKMMAYFESSEAGRDILAPATKGPFVIKQSKVDDISKDKNLAGKTYKGTITGMPNNMSGADLIAFWIDKASSADKGYDTTNGYQYGQLISKFIMGAVFYNQVVDGYLDENLSADKKPNDQPYGKGAAYTGKEHSWDEAFGYFGTPAHTLKLTPKQVYDISKLGSSAKDPKETMAAADYNKDGVVDLKTEMTFAPAYYAAGYDASVYDMGNSTSYLHTITRAFLDGRKVIADAKGEKLSDAERAKLVAYAATIEENWERTLAESVFKYAGSVYKDMVKLQSKLDSFDEKTKEVKAYANHWSELKGFALALQTGRKNLGGTAAELNRLIGAGPVMPDLGQVVGIDANGNYVREAGPSWGDYMVRMVAVQKLLIDEFGVKARNNDMTGEVSDLSRALGNSTSAEND